MRRKKRGAHTDAYVTRAFFKLHKKSRKAEPQNKEQKMEKETLNVEQVRKDLETFLSVNEVSQSALARALAVSAAAISTFRKGEYKGQVEALARKIYLYLENYKQKGKKTPELDAVFESKDYKMANFVINEAVNDGEIALITGTAGSGKSTIAQNYAKSHPNAIFVEATLHTTAKVLLEELEMRLNLPPAKNCHEKVVHIAKELKRRDVIILIDEAEHLSVRALEDLRRIWDFSSVPLVLFGTEILMKNLMGKNGELRQLYSRIGGKWQMCGLDEKECEAISAKGVFKFTQGNFRSSVKLYKRAKRLAGLHEVGINDEIVAQAVAMIIL